MDKLQRVQNYVDEFGLGLKVIEQEGDTSTVQKAAETLGLEVGQIAKSLLFRLNDEKYIMIVSAGDVKIDSKKFKKIFSERPNLAKPKEVEEITGYPIGGVCPFAMEKPIDVYLDTSLKRFDVVLCSCWDTIFFSSYHYGGIENCHKR